MMRVERVAPLCVHAIFYLFGVSHVGGCVFMVCPELVVVEDEPICFF